METGSIPSCFAVVPRASDGDTSTEAQPTRRLTALASIKAAVTCTRSSFNSTNPSTLGRTMAGFRLGMGSNSIVAIVATCLERPVWRKLADECEGPLLDGTVE